MLANWIVPFRRAVIGSPTTWWSVFASWSWQLFRFQPMLQQWYGVTPAQFRRGLEALRTWTLPPECEPGDPLQQCPEPLDFSPRLWKGPLRVVWEELGASGDPPAQVCSRGMVYGQSNALSEMWPGSSWEVEMFHWGSRSQSERVHYPEPRAPSQRNGMPITPAWACTSSVVWLAYFLLDRREAYSGPGMVNQGLNRPSDPTSDYTTFLFDEGVLGPRRRLQVRGGSDPALQFFRGSSTSAEHTVTDDVAIMGYDLPSGAGHNVAYLKLKSPKARVATGQELDSKGFLSAYDPMSGEDMGGDETGRYVQLNAPGPCSPEGSLTSYAGRRWDTNEAGQRVRVPAQLEHRRSRCNSHFTRFDLHPALTEISYAMRFAAGSSGGQGICDAMGAVPLPRILIYPMEDSTAQRLYAERAVPFPTMRECKQSLRMPNFNYGPGGRVTLSRARSASSIQLDEAQKRATDRDSTFLPGDVVEFPLATFLHACGVSGFSGRQFNPRGSFLLGDTVTPAGASPALHDNLIAMRTQLFLNLTLGAFYSEHDVGQGRGTFRRDGEQVPAILGWSRCCTRATPDPEPEPEPEPTTAGEGEPTAP